MYKTSHVLKISTLRYLNYKDYSEQIFGFFKKNITDVKRIIEKD